MRHVKSILIWLCCLSLGVPLLVFSGVLGFGYFRKVENDPFPVSAEVAYFGKDQIKLKDGRIIQFDFTLDTETQELVQKSGGRVGLEVGESGTVSLYARRERFICGLGSPMITIPLFPCNVPRYQRALVALGEFEKPSEKHDARP